MPHTHLLLSPGNSCINQTLKKSKSYIYINTLKHKLFYFSIMTPYINELQEKKTNIKHHTNTTFLLFPFIKSTFKECACISAAMSFLKFTAALSKAIFFPLPCSSAFVNISAKGIRPQLYFPFPQRLTTQSLATLLSDCLIPSRHSSKASLFLLSSFAPRPRSQTALLAMCAISHAKPPTH